ncbi:hypothetical protein CERZMDRAFT_39116 [Cercospora zeae-maydis SCOH1-5]|uniref:Major facilitator superfamily (MFS) profile domain-containing protein n=1 Tax=Cercospora zeae-maydis SCOH1-5 TaxID=717836 RepID=A0A6A6FJL0_9PEZI|nr:hypothetical protein CERZMDRAFT_39116 [Cercospora zeae-maydis SCOH1-5]
MASTPDILNVSEDDHKLSEAPDGRRGSEDQHLVNCYSTPPRSRAFSVASFLSVPNSKPQLTPLPQAVSDLLEAKQLLVDGYCIISWRPDSISLPRNWPSKRKFYHAVAICLAHFSSSLIGNTGSTVAGYAAEDLGISYPLSIFSFVTIYWIGQALGCFIFASTSEAFGNKRLFSWAAACFGTTCLLVGTGPQLWSVIVGRFFSGMLAAVPSVVALGTFENLWNAKGRIWAVSVWAVSGVLGFAFGPVLGAHVSASWEGWQWVYYGGLIANILVAIFCFPMAESRPNVLLHEEVRQIEKATGFGGLRLDESLRIPSWGEFAHHHLLLPLKLAFTEPLVLLCTLLATFSFGLTTLFTEALPIIYETQFVLTPQTSSLTFLGLAIGALLFSFLPRLYDTHRHHTTPSTPLKPNAEKHLWSYILLATPTFFLSLWWFSFTIPNPITDLDISPSVWLSIFPLLLIGFCLVEFTSVLPLYLTEIYSHHTASANASLHAIHSLLAGTLPLIFAAEDLEAVGSHRTVWVLAGIATGYCGVAVIVVRFLAKRVREKSKFARKLAEEREQGIWNGKMMMNVVAVEGEGEVVRLRSRSQSVA